MFAAFECANRREKWTAEIEATIRNDLADTLAAESGIEALGYVDGDKLAAIAAWKPNDDETWFLHLLAVAKGYRRHHHAEHLKREVLARAFAAGAFIVQSDVHVDNVAMLNLNRKLGAQIHPGVYGTLLMRCFIDPAAVPAQDAKKPRHRPEGQ